MDLAEAFQIVSNSHHFRSGNASARAKLRDAGSLVKRSEVYRGLNSREGKEIALEAFTLFDKGITAIPQHILTNLADVVPGSLEGLYPLLLTRNLSWGTNSFFREADQMTRDAIIKLLDSGKEHVYSRVDLLCALAWMGDEEVQNIFSHWQQKSPSWSASLPVAPDKYTLVAGWELTPWGTRRNLYMENNYDIISSQWAIDAHVETSKALVVGNVQKDLCGWCGQSLAALFDINLTNSHVAFLGSEGRQLHISICSNCSFQFSAYEDRLYMDVDWSGNSYWSTINGKIPPKYAFLCANCKKTTTGMQH